MSEETTNQQPRSGGCLRLLGRGCLGLLGLAAAGAVLVYFVFLRGPNAELMFSGAPDPVATARLNAELENAGLEGASALVIPIRGQNGQIAIMTLDESQGFVGDGAAGFDAFTRSLVNANREGGHNISQVAVDYRGSDGQNLYTVTTDQATLEAYADGQLSREQMLAETDVDFSSLLDALETYQDVEGGS